jgi:hypothetical protein
MFPPLRRRSLWQENDLLASLDPGYKFPPSVMGPDAAIHDRNRITVWQQAISEHCALCG